MDAETLEALKGSIAKWEGIVAGKRKDRGETDCPLCAKFNDCVDETLDPDCAGCPVAQKAGASYCRNTPYMRFSALNMAFKRDASFAQQRKTAAQAELDFLKSLLPVTV